MSPLAVERERLNLEKHEGHGKRQSMPRALTVFCNPLTSVLNN